MKTFKEFLEESYLIEMRKEDKVKGKKKTPLYVDKIYKTVQRSSEGKWERKDIPVKRPNPVAAMGRYMQGREGHPHYYSTEGGTSGGPGFGYRPVKHNTGGPLRGVKKVPGEKKEPKWEPGVDSRTPAKKVADRRAKAKMKQSGGYDYRKGFSGY